MDYFPETNNIFTIKTDFKEIVEEDNCYICGDSNDDNSIKLECNHRFHKTCIQLNNQFNKTGNSCPYCRRKIPIVCSNITPQFNKCKAILKTGKNIGNICGANCLNMSGYCGRHSNSKK